MHARLHCPLKSATVITIKYVVCWAINVTECQLIQQLVVRDSEFGWGQKFETHQIQRVLPKSGQNRPIF
jgi:hypothetical protein